MGRSARPTIPCAKRITGSESRNAEGPADAGPSMLNSSAVGAQEPLRERAVGAQEHFDEPEPTPVGFVGGVGLAA
jgi:hypothetical protein